MSSDPITLAFGQCPTPLAQTDRILLAHGSGGRLTGQLIEQLLVPAFRNPQLEALEDQATIELEAGARLAFTTDSYVVTPIFFPGGDIGTLAVHGTVNDLAVGGARPLALSLAFILEEGLPMGEFQRVVRSAAAAAAAVGVPIVTGDTKVVGRGGADRIFINTSGIGLVPEGIQLGASRIQPGDAVLVSGTIGDHGMAIMSQREGLGLETQISSDTAALHDLVSAILNVCPDVHAMRDPTRGGLAATLVETADRNGLGIEIDEQAVPVAEAVRGACELLGLDPFLVANEGKLVAFVPPNAVDAVLDAMRQHPLGRQAARIGHVTSEHPRTVLVRTVVGGRRILELPFAEPLPRIC